MADTALTALPAASALAGTEVLYAGQTDDAKVTAAVLRDYFRAKQPGQCELTWSSSTLLKLSPFNGNLLTINSLLQIVPDAGITLLVTGLAGSTNFYIYAYMSGGTMTLEASTTAYAVQAGTGVMIRSGDATRTLVGFARTNSTPNWFDQASVRWVRSWFNEKPIYLSNIYTTPRANSTINTWVEPNTEIRCQFLAWAGETFNFRLYASLFGSAIGNNIFTGVGLDGLSNVGGSHIIYAIGSSIYQATKTEYPWAGLTEGFHYATLASYVSVDATYGLANLYGNLLKNY